MSEFYHIARANIDGLQSLNFIDFKGDNPIIKDKTSFFTKEDVISQIESLYNGNITSHARGYLYVNWPAVNDGTRSYVENCQTIEFAFEMVRRLKFPNRFSRFQSIFGCESLDDAIELRKQFNFPSEIYKVATSNYFKADMSLLFTPSIIGIEILAERYWNGLSGPSPQWEILMKPPVQILDKIQLA